MKTLTRSLVKYPGAVLVVLIALAVAGAAQEGMDLAVDNKLDNPDNLDLNFKLIGEIKVANQKLKAEAANVTGNACLKTLGTYRDFVAEFELVMNQAQKGIVCVSARSNSSGAYLFYIYPQGLFRIMSLKAETEGKNDELDSFSQPLAKETPYQVKVSVSGNILAMKIWPASEAEPKGWLVKAEDKTNPNEGKIVIEIQRDATPGSYSAELANLKIWTPKAK